MLSHQRIDFKDGPVGATGVVGNVKDMLLGVQAGALELDDLSGSGSGIRVSSVHDSLFSIEVDQKAAVVPAPRAHELYGGTFIRLSTLVYRRCKGAKTNPET
jgi:hypothetical protein